MRPRGLEPPRPLQATRPSTLRVYQFRHRRVGTAIIDGGRLRTDGVAPLWGGATLIPVLPSLSYPSLCRWISQRAAVTPEPPRVRRRGAVASVSRGSQRVEKAVISSSTPAMMVN